MSCFRSGRILTVSVCLGFLSFGGEALAGVQSLAEGQSDSSPDFRKLPPLSSEDRKVQEATLAEVEDEAEQDVSLFEQGLEVGVAAAVFLHPSDSVGPGFSGLAYIGAYPGMWGASEETKAACTARWARKEKRKAVYPVALVWGVAAAREVHDLLQIEDDVGRNRAVTQWIESNYTSLATRSGVDTEVEKRARLTTAILQMQELGADGRLTADDLELASRYFATARWSETHEPRCFWRHLGAWGGYPFAYQVETSGSRDDVTFNVRQRVTPVIAGGVIAAPYRSFSLLLGYSYSRVDNFSPQGIPSSSEGRRGAHSFVIGVGGNVNALIPKRG